MNSAYSMYAKRPAAGEANKVKQIHDKLLERNADVGVSDPQDFNSHLSKVRAKMYSQ